MTEITIGMKYTLKRGKITKEHTVEDIYKTYNHKNELVKTCYVTSSLTLGQKVYNYETPKTSIILAMQRGIK